MKVNNPHLYRPDTDGLRAIAVLSVLAYHAFPEYVTGGFVGVDIFFVISGFLISSLMFKAIDNDKFSIFDFYARRIRRIFPALIAMMAACLIVGWYILINIEFELLGRHLAASSLFFLNFQLWSEAGYFDAESELKPLLHLWSLAIEEQFYIVWPLFVLLICKLKRNFQCAMIFVVILISFALSASAVYDKAATFYFPQTRFWELMLGGLLAWAMLRSHSNTFIQKRFVLDIVSLAGFFLLCFSVIIFNKHTLFPSWRALFPTFGALMLLWSGPSAWFNKYVLSIKPMIWIGLISYPLYLWHWPILAYLKILASGTPDIEMRAMALILSVILAWVTYIAIEKPLRHQGRKTVVFLTACMLSIGFIGYCISIGKVFPYSQGLDAERIRAAASDFDFPGRLASFEVDGVEIHRQDEGKKKVFYFGDSNIQQYWPRIERVMASQSAPKSVIFAAWGGCAPIKNTHHISNTDCDHYVKTAYQYAIEDDDIDTVVIAAQWYSYFMGNGFVYDDNTNGSLIMEAYDSAGAQMAYLSFEEMLNGLIASGKNVYLVLNIPVGAVFDPHYLIHRPLRGALFKTLEHKGIARADYDSMMEPIHARLIEIAERTGVYVLQPATEVCDELYCYPFTEEGEVIYRDSEHWRASFVREHMTFLDITLQ